MGKKRGFKISKRKYNVGLMAGLLTLVVWLTIAFNKKEREENREVFQLEYNAIVISPQIDGRQLKFSLDCGIEKSQISDSVFFLQNQSKRNRFRSGNGMVVSPFFTGNLNFDFVVSAKPDYRHDCLQSMPNAGRLAYDFLSRNEAALLDFDQLSICGLSDSEIVRLKSDDYREVKSSFKNNSLFLYITINRKEYAFLFDTGFIGTFEMIYQNELPFLKENHETVESNIAINQADNIKTEFIYTKNILFSGIYYSAVFPVSESVRRQRMGMGFIKGFNWIIDFENRKIFVKKSTKSIDKGIALQEYQTGIRDNSLIVCKKNSNRKKYALGTIITAVNGEKITPGSICKIQDLLNNSVNWNLFDIETDSERR